MTFSTPYVPDARATGQSINLATLGASVVIPLANAQGTIGLQVTGLTAGGATLAILASEDGGTTYNAKNALVSAAEGTIAQVITLDGSIRINCAGCTNIMLKVSIVGTGSAAISYSASSIGGGVVSLGAALPPGTNSIGTVADTNSAPFLGFTAITNGTAFTQGRSIAFLCTASGTATFTMSDGSSIAWPITASTSMQVLPLAATNVVLSGGAAATFWIAK
jgi:hypothetical protein